MKKIKLLYIIGLILVLSSLVHAGEMQEEEPLVTIMLFETDLREALNEISLQTGVNVIPDITVSGFVTADLEDVPLEKALRMILIGGGYTYRKIDDFYLVGLPDPKNTTYTELSQVEIVKLNHITVRELIELVPSFLQHYIVGSEESNALTISAPPAELERIKKLISQLDIPQKQIEVKVVVTEVDSKFVKDMGIDLFETNPEKFNEGYSYSSDDGLLVLKNDVYNNIITKLKLMEEEQKAKIEANPKILVADGETAKLFIGEQQILLISSENDNYSRIEEIEVGVGLNVKADIVGQDNVILNLAPSISHFIDEVRPDLVVKENNIETTIRLKNNQTVLLAGMTLQDNSEYTKKVPILGDIPLVRWLFRNNKTTKQDRELLVFVTPVIHD